MAAQNALAVVQPMATSIHQEKEAWNLMREQAAILIASGFLPTDIRKPEQAIHIMMKGRELGIPPTYALSNITIIKGKPSCTAELMLALIRRDHGPASIRVKASTNDACVVEWRTPGWDGTQTYGFTIQDARQAGLVQPNSNWTKYPAAMLRARCISAVARMAFPESIAGMYSPGEMGEQVIVTDEGEVISGEIDTDDPTIIDADPVQRARAIEADATRRFVSVEDIDEKIAAGAIAISARETAAVLEARQAASSKNAPGRATSPPLTQDAIPPTKDAQGSTSASSDPNARTPGGASVRSLNYSLVLADEAGLSADEVHRWTGDQFGKVSRNDLDQRQMSALIAWLQEQKAWRQDEPEAAADDPADLDHDENGNLISWTKLWDEARKRGVKTAAEFEAKVGAKPASFKSPADALAALTGSE